MITPEFMRVSIKYFPQDIIAKYKLNNIVTKDRYVYIRIKGDVRVETGFPVSL